MSTTLKWGLITGMVYVIFSLVSNLMGMQEGGNKAIGFLLLGVIMVITFFTIFQGVKETRDQDLDGYLTLGQGFLTGFKIALIAALISGIFTLIYCKIIDPEFTNKLMANTEEQWDKAGMSEEARDVARKWAGYFMSPFVLSALSMISGVFWGVIKALVAGAILKKDPPPTVMPLA